MDWAYAEGKWASRTVKAPENGALAIGSLFAPSIDNDPLDDDDLISYCDFLTTDSLMLGLAGSDERQLLQQLPQRFDATGMTV